jgi:hypothetical protein
MNDALCACGTSMLFIEAVEPNAGDAAVGPLASSIWWCPAHSFWRIYQTGTREQILGKNLGIVPAGGPPPHLTLFRYWRLIDRAGRAVVCELCQTDVGLEVRYRYEGQALLRSQRASSTAAAFCVAEAWWTLAREQDGATPTGDD